MVSSDFVTKMPGEILGEIFYHCSTFNPDAPLILSAVCRTFYGATRISPQIWGKLRLTISEDACVDKLAFRKAALFLSMSGACPLNLHVDIPKGFAILDESDTLVHSRGAQVPLLSSLLHQRRERIRSLSVRSYTERQAYSFIDSIYAPLSSFASANHALALHRLTLHVTFDALPVGEQHLPSFMPLLSSLNFLKLTTPSLPDLTLTNLSHLQTLAIIRPIRSHPIPLESIVQILHSATALSHFELETRLDLPPESSPTINPADNPFETPRNELITMPALTHLSLRTNNNPVLLSCLVVPALHTLHLNALDGKRPGRAEETATALRFMLMRMDMIEITPPPQQRGIEVLELAGVSIYRGPRGRNERWEWCFRRMRSLRRISARNMDAEHLVELLSQGMGRSSIPGYIGDRDGQRLPDNAVCPSLECLAVPAPEASSAMRLFKVARPYVKIVALGYSGGASYAWDNEDALKPRVAASPPTSGGGFGFGFGSSFGRARQAEAAKPEASTSAPVAPPVVVGGFGFGSHFNRTRQAPPDHRAPEDYKKLRRNDGINW